MDLQSKSKQDRDRDIGKPDDNCDDDVVQLRHARSHAHLERGGGGGGGGGGGSRTGGAVIRKPEVFDIPLKQKSKNEDQEEEEEDMPPSPTPEVKTKEIHIEDLDILKKKPGLQVMMFLLGLSNQKSAVARCICDGKKSTRNKVREGKIITVND